jgi:NAD(P)-dependent dehydrogenase (short-subunit alcohol dehydrogenase family)/acyl carrier protein
MLHSLELLGNFGRFVEIGKKDVYANSRIGLEVFSRGLSYFMIDFEKMVFEKPAEVGALLEEIIPYFEKGIYKPLASKIFPIADVQNAFDYMSKGVHIGKVVVKVESESLMIEQSGDVVVTPQASATYLITGGYGGLGLTFARWLIENGARHLVLTGRKGPSDEALDIIESLEQSGARIIIEQADVSSLEDLQKVVQHIPQQYPLKGIFHMAGILDDASVMNLTTEQYFKVLQAKVNGAWNLDQLSKNLDLDYFVLFSSSTILFGSPGQTAYVAANAYMDALARKRKQEGKAALAIQWGTVAEVGLAAAAGNRADRLSDEGIAPLMPAECLEIFEALVSKDIPVIGAFKFDISKWQNSYPAAAKDPFFDLLRSDIKTQTSVAAITEISIQDLLAQLPDIEQKTLFVEEKLKEKVGLVVKLSPDQIGNKTPFKSLGIDSLMSIQLKNQLEKVFEITLSVTSFWTYANIRDYTQFLLGKLITDNSSNPTPATEVKELPVQIVAPAVVETIDEDVSLDDLSKLLEDELNDL